MLFPGHFEGDQVEELHGGNEGVNALWGEFAFLRQVLFASLAQLLNMSQQFLSLLLLLLNRGLEGLTGFHRSPTCKGLSLADGDSKAVHIFWSHSTKHVEWYQR